MPNITSSKLIATVAFFITITLFYQWFSESKPGSENATISSDTGSESHSHTAQTPVSPSTEQTQQTTSIPINSSSKHAPHAPDKTPFQHEPVKGQSFEAAYRSKQDYAQEVTKKALAEMSSHTEGQNKAELMQQHAESIATRQQMKQAAENGDWAAFLDARKQLNDLMGAGDMLSLLDAMQFSAPKHVFQELLRTGSQFTPDMIMFLAINNNVDQVKMLISLGFDIHMTDRYEKNALLYSIEFNAPGVFRFLLTQGVSIAPSMRGFDALDTALDALLKPQNKSLVFANSLLELAADTKPSHAYLLSKLEQQRPAIYQEIISKHAFLH